MKKVSVFVTSLLAFMLSFSVIAIAETADATGIPASSTPQYKDPAFWVGIGSGVLALVLTILAAFGYTKWAKNERFKLVMKVADNAISWFKDYAKKTPAKWDDIVAMVLEAVAVRLGELSDEEVAKVKAILEVRKPDLVQEDASSSDSGSSSDSDAKEDKDSSATTDEEKPGENK